MAFLGQSGDKCGVAAQYCSRLRKSCLPDWWWTMPRYHWSIKHRHTNDMCRLLQSFFPPWPDQVFPMRTRNGWTMRLTVVFLEFIWTRMDCLAAAKSGAFSSGRALTMASTSRFQTFTSLFIYLHLFSPKIKLKSKRYIMLPWRYSRLGELEILITRSDFISLIQRRLF